MAEKIESVGTFWCQDEVYDSLYFWLKKITANNSKETVPLCSIQNKNSGDGHGDWDANIGRGIQGQTAIMS